MYMSLLPFCKRVKGGNCTYKEERSRISIGLFASAWVSNFFFSRGTQKYDVQALDLFSLGQGRYLRRLFFLYCLFGEQVFPDGLAVNTK